MPDAPERTPSPKSLRWFTRVFGLMFFLFSWLELRRLQSAMEGDSGFITWLTFWDMETTVPWLLMLLLPILIWVSRRRRLVPQRKPLGSDQILNASTWKTCLSAVVIFAISLGCSWQIGSRQIPIKTQAKASVIAFADLPPAYHDEYSYLLQARTFLNGRLSWPGMDVRPDLFHQFHVLNEHRTVSRYFPWTGLWIAPFEAIGRPMLGQWLAGALSAVMFYLSLLQITRMRTAFLGGLLISVSPGLAVFSNLLLAHHPTMLALSVFTWSFFRMMKTRQLKFACISGIGLTLAMLARPMTAAGYGLPFGIWLCIQLIRDRHSQRLILGFAIPLLAGFAFLAILNDASTGSWKRSAYQEYTERFTPRHGYGFNNALDRQTPLAPSAIQKYDRWAFNLTPQRAIENVALRFVSSFTWSLAIAPLLLGILMAGPALFARNSPSDAVSGRAELRLLAAAIVTMHIAHVPYWYAGIMNWHYVFETAPLLLMLTAVGFAATLEALKGILGRKTTIAWLSLFLVAGLLPGWMNLAPYNDNSKVSAAVNQLCFSRVRFAVFNQSVQHETIHKPALILVDESKSDPQLSYIINPPDLDADVLVCRRPETDVDTQVRELQRRFPNRHLYSFDPTTQQFATVASAID